MEKSLIYVAGNPSLYPIEYYDSETDSYQGVIPELLQRFAEEYDEYEIRYYDAGREDERAQMAASRQVDLISGCTESEEFKYTDGKEVLLFRTVEEGEENSYYILFSEVTPESLKKDLREFFSSVTQEEKTGLVLEASESAQNAAAMKTMTGGLIGLSVAVLALAAVIAALVRKYRKRLSVYEQNKEADETTGVGNAAYLEHYYRSLVNDKNRILYRMFCFYIDIDRMERIGGHGETNRFLRHTAVILQEYASDTDILARISDVGFVLLKLSGSDEGEREWLSAALQRIRSFSELNGTPYQCEVSAGIYPLKAEDYDLNEIVFSAYMCAQSAYRRGQDYLVCSEDMIHAFAEERKLQSDISRGFERQEFQLYIQFYVEAGSRRIVGGEALSRWEHPERGFLLPGQYIPLMEEENMIHQMDYYILEKTCAFLDDLKKNGIENFFISCNFSRKTFSDPEFMEFCRTIIESYDFSRELLVFEVTESASGRDVAQMRKNALALSEYGVRIALDDFGEGFTSFYDLQDYPVNGVKLDKSLIDNCETPKGKAILRSMIQIGHELGLTILAEGIETDEQVNVLLEIGCDVIQGFRFHYPIPAWEAKKTLMLGGAEQEN